MSRGHVCVVGAGIVGCATAYALARDGWRVTLVDAHAEPGLGVSRANGAQLSYSYVEPLATPQALLALPRWLLSPDSPLRWRPRWELAHWRWLLEFVSACRWSRVRRTTEALLALSFRSRDTLHAWLNEQGADCAREVSYARPGKLVLYRSHASRRQVERQLAWQAAMGCEQELIPAQRCVALEPALATTGGGAIAFGVWTASEEVADARRLSVALARSSGATLRMNCAVQSLELRGDRVCGVRLAAQAETIPADHVVLAAGADSAGLLGPLGLAQPIEPIKGYSVTLPILRTDRAPRVSLTDTSRKVVYARMTDAQGDWLRVAGFAELCGHDGEPSPRRIEALCRGTEQTFPGACALDDPRPWTGLRPATASGLPIVGPTQLRGLWLNLGHGSLGLTLAAGSAAELAGRLAGRPPPSARRPGAR